MILALLELAYFNFPHSELEQHLLAWILGESYPFSLLVGMCLVSQLWKSIWRVLRYLKIDFPYDPAMPLWGIYVKKMKSAYEVGICNSVFTATQSTAIAKTWKQSKCLLKEEWIKML